MHRQAPEEDLREAGANNPGYFPASIGLSVGQGRYNILRKLGYGACSSVWLARDVEGRRFVALKILNFEGTRKLKESATEERLKAQLREIKLAQTNHRGYQHIMSFHGSFELQGPRGNHLCFVTEVLGCSLGDIRTKSMQETGDYLMPMKAMKHITMQLLYALEYLHDVCGIVHGDIKPENILSRPDNLSAIIAHELESNPPVVYDIEPGEMISPTKSQPIPFPIDSSDDKIVVLADIDNVYWRNENLDQLQQPRCLRAPEVILGYPWDASADIWNLGCIIVELLTGYVLFEPWGDSQQDLDEDHLALMCEALGETFTPAFLSKCRNRNQYFNENGSFLHFTEHEESHETVEGMLTEALLDCGEQSVRACALFLRRCLRLNPEERATARQLIDDPWLSDVPN